MKLIVPSQSKSPASVTRLAEMSGSLLLNMIGLSSRRPLLTMLRESGSFVLVAGRELLDRNKFSVARTATAHAGGVNFH